MPSSFTLLRTMPKMCAPTSCNCCLARRTIAREERPPCTTSITPSTIVERMEASVNEVAGVCVAREVVRHAARVRHPEVRVHARAAQVAVEDENFGTRLREHRRDV